MTTQIIDFNNSLQDPLDKTGYCVAVLSALEKLIPDLWLRKALMLLRDEEFGKYKGGIYKHLIPEINVIAKAKEAMYLK